MGKQIGSVLEMRQAATPTGTLANPSTGGNFLYFKSDGLLYKKDSSGVETPVDTTGSSTSTDIAPVRVASTVGQAYPYTGFPTIDGITVVAGDRVLQKNQTDQTQNGIFVVSASGNWTRATDADTGVELASADDVSILLGTVNGGAKYRTLFKSTDTVGGTAMPWAEVYSDLNPPQTLSMTETAAGSVGVSPSTQAQLFTPDGQALWMKDDSGTPVLTNVGQSSNMSTSLASTEVPSSWPKGTSTMYLGADTTWPDGAGLGVVQTMRYQAQRTTQWFFPKASGLPWWRSETAADVWGGWSQMVSVSDLALKADISSPTFTGTVVVPVASGTTSPTQKTYVDTALNAKANLAGPTFTGTVVVPVASGTTSPTQKTYVDAQVATKQDQMLYSRLTALVGNSTITYANSGLTVNAAAGKTYRILARGTWASGATTAGFMVRLGGTAVVTGMSAEIVVYGVTATTSVFRASTALNTNVAVTNTAGAASTNYPWSLMGEVRVSTAGTIRIDFVSGAAGIQVNINADASLELIDIT